MGIFNHKFLNLTFILSILLVLSSCAPKSRTITPLTQSNLSKIKKIAVVVKADEELDVLVEGAKRYWSAELFDWGVGIMDHSAEYGGIVGVPFILLGIVAVLPEYGIRSHLDEKHKESLESKLTQFHPGELMTEKLINYLELSNAGFTVEIPEVKSPSLLKAEGFDTILEVNLKEWEFKLCTKTAQSHLNPEESEVLNKWNKYHAGKFLNSEDAIDLKQEELEEIERLRPLVSKFMGDKVRTLIKLSGRMLLIDDNNTVWEREEFYKDENCYWLGDLKTQPELLVDILTRAIQNLAENTVNEIVSSNKPVD